MANIERMTNGAVRRLILEKECLEESKGSSLTFLGVFLIPQNPFYILRRKQSCQKKKKKSS
jgi:hypothetical protein